MALFTRLLPKVKSAAAPVVVSFQTAPLLSITAPLNVIVRTVVLVEPKFILPDMVVAPLTVKSRYIVSVAPLLMVSAAHVYDAPMVLPCTLLAPVVAIITESVAAGATPPTQVLPVPQTPPLAVLVLVAALAVTATRSTANSISSGNCQDVR